MNDTLIGEAAAGLFIKYLFKQIIRGNKHITNHNSMPQLIRHFGDNNEEKNKRKRDKTS